MYVMGIEDYFSWNSFYEKKADPLILTTYEEKGKFNLSVFRTAIIDRDGIEVRGKPREVPAAIKEVRRVVSALEERGYTFILKDVQDRWLRDPEGKS